MPEKNRKGNRRWLFRIESGWACMSCLELSVHRSPTLLSGFPAGGKRGMIWLAQDENVLRRREQSNFETFGHLSEAAAENDALLESGRVPREEVCPQ